MLSVVLFQQPLQAVCQQVIKDVIWSLLQKKTPSYKWRAQGGSSDCLRLGTFDTNWILFPINCLLVDFQREGVEEGEGVQTLESHFLFSCYLSPCPTSTTFISRLADYVVEAKLDLVWVGFYGLSGPKTPLLSSLDIKVDYVGKPKFSLV